MENELIETLLIQCPCFSLFTIVFLWVRFLIVATTKKRHVPSISELKRIRSCDGDPDEEAVAVRWATSTLRIEGDIDRVKKSIEFQAAFLIATIKASPSSRIRFCTRPHPMAMVRVTHETMISLLTQVRLVSIRLASTIKR